MSQADVKISLPSFLKLLTSQGLPASKAMGAAGKIYKTHNTPKRLAQLTDSRLKSAGVEDKDVRRLVLAAIKKAGYAPRHTATAAGPSTTSSNAPSRSANSQPETSTKGARKKRKRDDDLNELLPDRSPDEGESFSSLEFNEILDEKVLMSKFTVVNRAPVMTAWSFVVAERMGFQREEALSIATVYTEMNAISKGVSLGIYEGGKQQGREASKDGSQPYVDLMGRRIPLFQTSTSQWRALSEGSPVSPSAAYSYIKRSLQQTTPQIVGALRLLSQSYSPSEINQRGYSLYVDFRPEVGGWGKRGEVRCEKILALRRKMPLPEAGAAVMQVKEETPSSVDEIVKIERVHNDKIDEDPIHHGDEEPDRKKTKGLSLEEYEAALDADDTFALAASVLDSLP